MEVPLETKVIEESEVYDYVRKRLNEGWVMVTGNGRCVEKLVKEAYMPDGSESDESEDFEIIAVPSQCRGEPRLYVFFLAKKTRRLKEYLKWKINISDYNFNTLLAIDFIFSFRYLPLPGAVCCLATFVRFEKSKKEQTIDKIINNLRMLISGGRQ